MILLAAIVAGALFVVVINARWFDEPLDPELVALEALRPVPLEDNAYVTALGLRAAPDRDPAVAGRQILRALHERHERGERIALTDAQMLTMLGGRISETWRARAPGLSCNARRYLDCADHLIAAAPAEHEIDASLAVLLARHEAMLNQTRFVESQERDIHTPTPPYGLVLDPSRLRLAMSYRHESTSAFLEKAARDFGFWTRALRDGDSLATKMIAIAGIRNTLDFVSALMRERALDAADIERIEAFVRPLSRDESDLGGAFLAEMRVGMLSETPPVAIESSWLARLLLQKNATLNEEFRSTIVPMRQRAQWSAREFYERRGYEPLHYRLRVSPRALYNLGGRLALANSPWDSQQFIARVHDENGRMSLVLLQAEIERNPGTDVGRLVDSSRHRNPYTGVAMAYDAQEHTIGFKCLHTAYHPPDPPDICSVALDAIGTKYRYLGPADTAQR